MYKNGNIQSIIQFNLGLTKYCVAQQLKQNNYAKASYSCELSELAVNQINLCCRQWKKVQEDELKDISSSHGIVDILNIARRTNP